ncbi:MAG: TadE/TadG family type IV pilus assembly protein [Planctomycetota bacterium]|jgi:hypothetical protein
MSDVAKASRKTSAPRREGGAILVEFALTAFILYFLVAGTIELGRLLFTHQAVQDATRLAARELAHTSLPGEMTFDEALQDPAVKARIFDANFLVIDLDTMVPGGDLNAYFGTLPVVNQALRPVMIFEITGGRRLLRYPGALLVDASTPSGLTVGVPLVVGRAADGTETIQWLPVLEEIENPNFPDESVFPINSPAPQGGMVALRINYPYQAAALSGFRPNPAGPVEPNLDGRIRANDAGVSVVNPAEAPGGLLPGDGGASPYAGPYGLGKQFAFAEEIRPFRKLLSPQALSRREVWE